jgi:hypothetical protein
LTWASQPKGIAGFDHHKADTSSGVKIIEGP